MDGSSFLWFSVLFFLVLLSALFSGSETALTAINRAKVRKLSEDNVRGAKRLEALLENPSRLLSAILLGNNLVNILAASVATNIAVQAYGNIGIGIATGILTFIILVFGEITPKTFAIRNPERFALAFFLLISGLVYILYPISRLLVIVANGILKLVGQKSIKEGPFLTAEELKTLVVLGEEEGVIEEKERKMIHSILEFGYTVAREIMVPRTEMVCVRVTQTIGEALEIAQEHGFSRIPVYEKNIDNIVGILYVKDLLNFITRGRTELKVKDLSREAYYVPETKRVDELLKEFQLNKVHMAIVVDEYGGTAGLVTLEDVLEEIVGEIFDEYDFKEEARIEEISESQWELDGRLDVDAVGEFLGIKVDEDETETLGGFITTALGHVPEVGESIKYDKYEFVVLEVENRRVSKVRVNLLEDNHFVEEELDEEK